MQNVTEQRDSLLLPFNSCARQVTRCSCGSVGNNQSNREQIKVFSINIVFPCYLLTRSFTYPLTAWNESLSHSLLFTCFLCCICYMLCPNIPNIYLPYYLLLVIVVVLFLFSTTQINYKVDMKSELDLRLETKNISKYYMAALWRRAKCCCYN